MSAKISVLLPEEEAHRFDSYCCERGYKKSTLIARLIKELLDREQYPFQGSLLTSDPHEAKKQPESGKAR